MRLVNSRSLELEQFNDEDKLPPYVILSHVWKESEEVSLQELFAIKVMVSEESTTSTEIFNMDSGGSYDKISNKAGYWKIVECCKRAAENGLSHVWIDTCCIDKTSSAELSEAINSMYRWYSNAAVCYAYLADVTNQESPYFVSSRWFKRGWTLQELIAPREVSFYSAEWQFIGTRTQFSGQISEVTRIDMRVLNKEMAPQSISIAKRMSWASKRETTRREDIAYCLLGLFGVNIPLLYGEGEKAFFRLQEEVIKISGQDHSLFAWRTQDPAKVWDPEPCGLLAKSPADFANSHDIATTMNNINNNPYFITHRGLCIELPLLAVPDREEICISPLNCAGIGSAHHRGPIAIYLKRMGVDQFARVFADQMPAIGRIDRTFKPIFMPIRPIYIKPQLVPELQDRVVHPGYWFYIPEVQSSTSYREARIYPERNWNPKERILKLPEPMGIAGAILFEHPDVRRKKSFVLSVAVDYRFRVSIRIQEHSDLQRVYEKNSIELQNYIRLWTETSSSFGSSYGNQYKEIITGGALVEVELKEEEINLDSTVHMVFGVHISIFDTP